MEKVNSKNKFNIWDFIIAIAIPIVVGLLSSWLTGDSIELYKNLTQPSIAPAGWVFPIVWTVLYILMGIASYIVYIEGFEKPEVKSALTVYAAQLIVNFFWTIIFFRLELRGLALVWLIFLWILIVITAVKFYRINKTAGYLMVPYLLWVSFAAVLNYAVWQLNK